MQYVDRYVPADTNGGWGVAAGVILLAVACIAMATYIHKKTWRQPTDVTWQAQSGAEKSGPAH